MVLNQAWQQIAGCRHPEKGKSHSSLKCHKRRKRLKVSLIWDCKCLKTNRTLLQRDRIGENSVQVSNSKIKTLILLFIMTLLCYQPETKHNLSPGCFVVSSDGSTVWQLVSNVHRATMTGNVLILSLSMGTCVEVEAVLLCHSFSVLF